MSATIVYDFEEEWKNSVDGFKSGLSLKDWLCMIASQLRSELARVSANCNSAVAERDKWRAWKPDDETLAVLKEQAMNRNGDHNGSLAACVVYIGALEARLRERDAAIARERAEEREACIRIARLDASISGNNIAAAIRARGEAKENNQ